VNPVNSAINWRQTAKVDDCIESIRQKERLYDHDFSVENIKAEMIQLATLPQSIKRLARELKDAKERLAELQTLEPHFDECIDIRAKHYQATHSGKRQKLSPLERDLANAKKRAEEAEDADFVAPETPPAQEA
jgi:chromosome segregation ATPase